METGFVSGKLYKPRELPVFFLYLQLSQKGIDNVIINTNNLVSLIEFEQAENEQFAPDEDVLALSRRIISENREAYEVLAK